jgi:hypothetical protein
MESVEKFFLKYAFPCANVLVDMGEISQEQFERVEQACKNNEQVSKKELEELFKAAFRRIKQIAKEMEIEDYWDKKVIEEYWHRNHNVIIDEEDGNYKNFPQSFCDFCKVHIAKVEQIISPELALIGYGNTKRPIFTLFVPDLKVGDKIRIHHAYAVEKAD